MQQYHVRWQPAAWERVRMVDFFHLSQAEACFAGLIPCIRDDAGGWAEIREGDEVVQRLGSANLLDLADNDQAAADLSQAGIWMPVWR